MFMNHVYPVTTEVKMGKMLNPLKLELQAALRHYVGTGNGTRVFCKSSQCSKLLYHIYNPILWWFK